LLPFSKQRIIKFQLKVLISTKWLTLRARNQHLPYNRFIRAEHYVKYVKRKTCKVTEKNPYYERKRRKNGTDQHDEDQQQTEKGLTIRHLECTISGLRITINELRKYKTATAAIQEARWNKLTAQAFTSNGYNIYTSSLANNHEFGTAFLVDSKFNHLVINFTPINERLCVIRIKGRFFNYSLINIHAPTNDSQDRMPRSNIMNSWSRHMQRLPQS
jgi:hypothetical protein